MMNPWKGTPPDREAVRLAEGAAAPFDRSRARSTKSEMHLAEQMLGRSLFYRYGRAADGLWVELPNVSGESHEFDRIEPYLAPFARVVHIGSCRARLIRAADIIENTMRVIQADAGALLCDDAACRCGGAYQQRLAHLKNHPT